jgi:DNA-binding transcriptional MerR regulator
LSENSEARPEMGFVFDATEDVGGITTPEQLPAKLYFRIGELSQLTGLKAHVLRYWESEFSGIAPKKMGSNHRMYRRKDVELILEIKHLLYEKRYTIEGAKKFLDAKPKGLGVKAGKTQAPKTPAPMPKVQTGLFVVSSDVAERVHAGQRARWRAELQEILALLNS